MTRFSFFRNSVIDITHKLLGNMSQIGIGNKVEFFPLCDNFFVRISSFPSIKCGLNITRIELMKLEKDEIKIC